MALKFFLLAATFFLSCTDVQRDNPYDSGGINFRGGDLSSESTQTGIIHGTPIDYAGEIYETVVIGTQTWMARNLNYNASGSSTCYDDNENNCSYYGYGRLYSWTAAMRACPSGWHIPSKDDWTTLMKFVGSPQGTKLKNSIDWNGKDIYGFSALPGGFCRRSWVSTSVAEVHKGCKYSEVITNGFWWSSEENGSSAAMYIEMTDDAYIYDFGTGSKEDIWISIRCLKD